MATAMTFDVESALPENLADEALDVTVLQEALMRLEHLQQSARVALFKKLGAHLVQASARGHVESAAFDAAVSELCAEVTSLLPDTPEAMLAQYAQHYSTLVEQEQQLVGQQQLDAAEQEFTSHLTEFAAHLAQGQLSDAAWCLKRLHKSTQEGQEAAAAFKVAATSEPTSPLALTDLSLTTSSRHLAWCDAAVRALAQVVEAGVAASVQFLPAEPDQDDPPPQAPQLVVRGSVTLYLAEAVHGLNLSPPEGLAGPRPVAVLSKEVWAAAAAAGTLSQHMQWLSGVLLQQALLPVLEGRGCWSQPQQHPPDVTVLMWQPTCSPHPADACRQALQVLASVAFGLDEGVLCALGDALWPPLSEAYVQLHARPAALAASAAGDSAALQALVQAAADLEDWASSLGFVDGACLAPAVASAVSALEARQQEGPLAAARQALLADLRPNVETLVVGEPLLVDSELYQRLLSGRCPAWEAQDPGCGLAPEAPLLASGQRRVTQGTVQLVQLVTQVLDQAARAGSQTASLALVHSLRKVAALALALPKATPAARQQLDTVLPLALLHFNRLWLLADALLEAVPVYTPVLKPVLGEPLGLMEPALLLRAEASKLLACQVAAQATALHELMASGFRGFSQLGAAGGAQEAITYRKTVSQLLHTMGRIGRALADHLTPEWIAQVAQQVLSRVCAFVVADIMAKSDIGIDDCKELREVLGPLAQQGVEVLVRPSGNHHQPPAEAAALSGIPVPVLRQVVVSACQPLRKLSKLLELLDTGLREMVVAWEKRRLQVVGFSADEVVHLLCALFEPSEYRRDAIARIRASA